jgi:hypothetical protein
MKVFIPCHECGMEVGRTGQARPTSVLAEYQDSCIYDITCAYGHRSIVETGNSKFEMIYQAGINSLRDEYYREAVFNFALALERFYEYSILFLLYPKLAKTNNYLMDSAELEQYQTLWNTMSKQSERQVGAFYVLYFNEFSELPPIFSAPWFKNKLGFDMKVGGKKVDPVYFRNIVIHQGITPSREQAVRYGEAVHQYIYSIIAKYREKYERRFHNISFHERKLDRMILAKEKPDIDGVLEVGSGVDTFIAVAQPSYINTKQSLFDLFPL